MSARPRLLFVYNADSGLFNTLADIGHKIFSPATYECRLCALTFGYLAERREWRDFIATLPADCNFLHRDEFRRLYPDDTTGLPAVFRLDGDRPLPCLDAGLLRNCSDLSELRSLVLGNCLGEP